MGAARFDAEGESSDWREEGDVCEKRIAPDNKMCISF